jgi:hypothetical protein
MAVADKTTVDFQLLFGKKLKPLYSKNVLNTTYDVYMIERHHQTKMFIQNIKDYPYNYDIQEEHVSLIAEQLKTSHHLMSPFIVIQMTEPKNATDDVFMLIDGHHRILALKKILEEDLAFKIELEVRVYKSDFMESALTQQLFRLCDRYKSINMDAFNGNEIRFYELLKEHMGQWLKQDLDLILKEAERKHYTKIAFDYKNEQNASVQFNSYLASTKEAAMSNIYKKVNLG